MTNRLGRGLGALIPSGPRPEVAQQQSATPGHAHDGGGESTTPTRGDSPDVAGHADAPERPAADAERIGEVPGASYRLIAADAIVPNARQPRSVFDEDELAELTVSIREVGLLQPIVVRPAGSDGYELIMGERRWRASQAAGLSEIPAIVRETDDTVMLRDALLENLHRSQLNPLEEAAAYQQMLDDFDCTQDELSDRIGRSRPQISNTLRLLRLPPSVQRRVAAGVLSAGHARALLRLTDGAAQERLAQRIVAEGMSVRQVEESAAMSDGVDDHADGTGSQSRTGRRSVMEPTHLAEVAQRLEDRLETRVRVAFGKRKGKITVEFATLDDLERIVSTIENSSR